jgi:dienelactone hydrolase
MSPIYTFGTHRLPWYCPLTGVSPMDMAAAPLALRSDASRGRSYTDAHRGQTAETLMHMNDIDYRDDAMICRGFIAYDDMASGKRPGVLVFHEGLGLGEHIIERTRRVAKLGYVALAADMFGDRRQARDLEDLRALVGDLRNEPLRLRARARAALATLASLPQVDAERLCAIGFCFGGSVVLELARDGADLKGVVSFHGVLETKAPASPGKVKASVLVLTGGDDPLAPPEHVVALENEMRAAGVRDWQVVTYGNTHHAFTNPAADGSFLSGTLYNEQSDRRSWAAMTSFLDEVL